VSEVSKLVKNKLVENKLVKNKLSNLLSAYSCRGGMQGIMKKNILDYVALYYPELESADKYIKRIIREENERVKYDSSCKE